MRDGARATASARRVRDGARATLTPSKWDDDGAAQAISPPKRPIPPQTTPPSWWKPHYEKLGVYDAGGPCESTPFWWPKDRRMYLMEGVCEGRHQIEVSHGDSKWNGYWGGPSSGPFCERPSSSPSSAIRALSRWI